MCTLIGDFLLNVVISICLHCKLYTVSGFYIYCPLKSSIAILFISAYISLQDTLWADVPAVRLASHKLCKLCKWLAKPHQVFKQNSLDFPEICMAAYWNKHKLIIKRAWKMHLYEIQTLYTQMDEEHIGVHKHTNMHSYTLSLDR